MSHWENFTDVLENTSANDDHCGAQNRDTTNPLSAGSYHSKSALRDHQSNLKLFLYRKSFNNLSKLTGSLPYNDECLLVLPDLWRCFYNSDYGLDRVLSLHTSSTHSRPSVALSRWVDSTMTEFFQGDLISSAISREAHIWQFRQESVIKYQTGLYNPMVQGVRRLVYLVCYLNFSLVVLNHMASPDRPDSTVELPDICSKIDDCVYRVTFNKYLILEITGQCVRIRTPVYDQIVQKDIFLTICDKINERFNTIIGAYSITCESQVLPVAIDYYDQDMHYLVRKIIDYGDSLVYKHRNRAFDLLGKFEAYCVSAILTKDNPTIWDCMEFQRNLLEDDRREQPDLYDGALQLCKILNAYSEQQLAEVHGLWRIWGHPIIDLIGGMKKMEATCLKRTNVDKKETKICEYTFKSTFFSNYYDKHGHYPLSNMANEVTYNQYSDFLSTRDKDDYRTTNKKYNKDKYLHMCLQEEKRFSPNHFLYNHSDWEDVIILQNFQVPQSLNLATMIKDKAISMTRSELISAVRERNSVFDPLKRRGVLKWLSEQSCRVKDYLLGIDANSLDEDSRIIGLYPKERELKTKARFFSLMSYNMRMFITTTEELLGKYLLPYFPMITMSDTLLSMIIRLYNMTTNIGAGDSRVTYSMNIDFSKWNQNMREATNDGVFQSIDRVLGFRRLISRTHEIFRQSYLYLCSGEYIPILSYGRLTAESPYSRQGDESGKEGLRQKGWTITTVCDILSLAFLHKVSIELIGGGDNQVLTVTITSLKKHSKESPDIQLLNIRERMLRFRNALAKKMEKRGLPLKLEETWISHRLLMYNKIMYLDGVPLKGRLKVVSRLFSNSNEGIATLGGVMSTLGTGFQSLSAKDHTPIFAWQMSRVILLFNICQFYLFNPICGSTRLDQQILTSVDNLNKGKGIFGSCYTDPQKKKVKRQLDFSGESTLSVKELFFICLYYHKILGGPGIGTPYSYIMKGFPDPLSEALSFNYSVMKNCARIDQREMIRCVTLVEKSNVPHWEHLLEDPVSINHNAPAHGIAALRTQAEIIMKSADIKNKQFKELINLGDNEYLRSLSSQLCSPPELEPRLLHDIVGSTIPGYVNTILSKVDQSTTLNKLAVASDVIENVYTSEIQYYVYLSKKVKRPIGHEMTTCPSYDSRNLRNYTWGKKIIGVSTPHPSSFLEYMQHTEGSDDCDHNYISVQVKRSFPVRKLKRGIFRPYFGSYTEEKFKTGILASAYGDEDILKRSLKIQKLLGWRYQEGTYMYNVIQSILRCVTNADPNKFLPTVEEITGDVEHRYHDMATKHGGIPTNLIQLYTHSSCNTSTFTDHSKGAGNESLHFQASIIYSSMMAILLTLRENYCSSVYHFHESCKHCIQKIEIPDEDNMVKEGIKLSSCPGNDLMYIKEEDIPIHYHSQVAFINDQQKKSQTNIDVRQENPDPDMMDRSSWKALFAVTLILKARGIKMSTMSLLASKLTDLEVVEIIYLIIIYTKVKSDELFSGYDIDDVRQMLEDYDSIVYILLSSPKFKQYTRDNYFSCPSGNDWDKGASSLFIILKAEEMNLKIKEEFADAYIKYQDPHYTVGRLLFRICMNPCSGTCLFCMDIIRKADDHEIISCGLHGEISLKGKYHLYSLDKLSKMLSDTPAIDRRKTDQDIIAIRRPNLFESMDKHGKRLFRKELELRKNSLFMRGKKEKRIITRMRCEWEGSSITTSDKNHGDSMDPDLSYISNSDHVDPLPSAITWLVSTAQAVHAIILDILTAKSVNDDHALRVVLEVDPVYLDVMRYKKLLLMINDQLEDSGAGDITVGLLLSGYSNIEQVDLDFVKDLHHLYSHEKRKNKVIHSMDRGEMHIDFDKMAAWGTDTILCSSESVGFIRHDFYYISDSSQMYKDIHYISQIPEFEEVLKISLYYPMITVTSYPMIYAKCTMVREAHVSNSLLSLQLSRSIRRPDANLCTLVSEKEGGVFHGGLLYCIYKKYVRVASGIHTREMADLIIKQLAYGLRDHAMRSGLKDELSWKCITIIRMIISIKILTSTSFDQAMQYYLQFGSASYRLGNYKEIILHKRRMKVTIHGNFINNTRGVVGPVLRQVVSDVSSWLDVQYRGDFTPSRIIEI